jgi:hypothetical protein
MRRQRRGQGDVSGQGVPGGSCLGVPWVKESAGGGATIRDGFRARLLAKGEPIPIKHNGAVGTGGNACPAAIAAAGVDEGGLARIDLQHGLAAANLASQALAARVTSLVHDVRYGCSLGFGRFQDHPNSLPTGPLGTYRYIPPGGI